MCVCVSYGSFCSMYSSASNYQGYITKGQVCLHGTRRVRGGACPEIGVAYFDDVRRIINSNSRHLSRYNAMYTQRRLFVTLPMGLDRRGRG